MIVNVFALQRLRNLVCLKLFSKYAKLNYRDRKWIWIFFAFQLRKIYVHWFTMFDKQRTCHCIWTSYLERHLLENYRITWTYLVSTCFTQIKRLQPFCRYSLYKEKLPWNEQLSFGRNFGEITQFLPFNLSKLNQSKPKLQAETLA